MIYLLLTLVFLLCVLGSWASFTDRVRNGGSYLPLMLAVSVGTGFLFACGCRLLDSKERIFVFSLGYDVVMATAYYLLPVLAFGCKPGPGVGWGALLIVLGLLLVHGGTE